MRSAALRKEKYKKKIRGLVLPGQTANYAPTAADRIHLEYCVKTAGITPMLQFSYVAFCEELLKHEASKRPTEALGIRNKWLNRGLVDATLLSVAACIGVTIPAAPVPPPCAWAYKMKLTFSGNVSATDLDDFPVLVHLTGANFDFAHAKLNGEDIRFMDADLCPPDGTPLKHEIECWDQAGEDAWVWVKVPRINGGSAIDFIYLYFDNPAAADGSDAVNVWTNNFRMVQHMPDDPDNTRILGSTTSHFVGNKSAAGAPLEVTANICKSQDFDGIDDSIVLPSGLCPLNNFTMDMWIRKDADTGNPQCAITYLDECYSSLLAEYPPEGANQVVLYFFAALVAYFLKTGLTVADGWKHFHCVKSSTAGAILYKDGNQVDIDAAATANLSTHDLTTRIGSWHDATWPMNGKIDEVRLSTVVRTPDWIKADFLTQSDALITYGAEETG